MLPIELPWINSCYELLSSQDCSESATFEESRSLHVSHGVIFRSRRSHPVQLLAGRPLKPSPRLFHWPCKKAQLGTAPAPKENVRLGRKIGQPPARTQNLRPPFRC